MSANNGNFPNMYLPWDTWYASYRREQRYEHVTFDLDYNYYDYDDYSDSDYEDSDDILEDFYDLNDFNEDSPKQLRRERIWRGNPHKSQTSKKKMQDWRAKRISDVGKHPTRAAKRARTLN